MSELEKLKAHAIANPEPLFAVLREIKPILLVKSLAEVRHELRS